MPPARYTAAPDCVAAHVSANHWLEPAAVPPATKDVVVLTSAVPDASTIATTLTTPRPPDSVAPTDSW